MKRKIRLLVVEDNENDAILICDQFQKNDYEVEFQRVCDEEAMKNALHQGAWDLITCDHNMPGFNSRQGLEILRTSGLDLPFLIVSGSIGETEAVNLIKAGAHDYIGKDAHLTRLVSAAEREIREAQERKSKRKAEKSQAFLAEASAILASSLDLQATLDGVAQLVVPRLADGCLIDLDDEDGTIQTFFPSPPDSKKKEILSQIRNHSLHNQSIVTIPLQARGKKLGEMFFFITDSGKQFDQTDLTMVEDLAHRSAFALDNARLYQKVKEAVQLRDEFLLIASHELRTPITSLKLKMQLLLRAFEEGKPEKLGNSLIIKMLTTANQQITRFAKLIEELLSISRIATGKLQLELTKVNLAQLIRDVAAQYTEELKSSGYLLTLEVEDAGEGNWDYLRIEQIVGNLLTNAMKYGERKPIKITASVQNKKSVMVVEDEGIGIAPEDQERVFERFERAVSIRHFGGLGMGLYITRQIVEAHGGTIHVESALGRGSRFTVELPLEQPG